MKYIIRRFLANVIGLALVALLGVAVGSAQGQGKKSKGTGGLPGSPYGFAPGKKVFFEGVFRVDGAPKGKMEILSRMVEPSEKSVVVYTRQSDDAIFKLAAALDARGDNLKNCPTHFVFVFAERKTLDEKAGRLKKIALLQSNRKNPREWEILNLDPKLTTLVLLVERGTIKTRLDVAEGTLSDARIDEITKAILSYGAPLPTTPLHIKDRLAGHPGGARKIVFSPDGKFLYSHGTQREDGIDARISKWDLATGKELANVASHGGSAHGLQVTRDGATLLSAGSDTNVKFWDAADLRLIDTVTLPETPFSLSLSPDEKTFALGLRDKTVRIFGMADKKEKLVLKGHPVRVRAVCYSPDGKHLVSGDEDGQMRLWNAVDGKEIATWAGHTNTVLCITFSQDGKWVASGGREMRGISGPGRARLWNVETGKEVRELESTRVNGVFAVALLPGKKTLAIAGESPLVRLIDLETGKEVGELNGHRSAIFSLALSPDGTTLASSEWSGPIRLWNLKSLK